MKTQYTDTVNQIINLLRDKLRGDVTDEDLRTECADILFWGYKQVSAYEEKEFATWLLNTSGEVDRIFVLDDDHPNFDKNNERFREKVESIIAQLKAYLPDSHETKS